MQQHGDRHRCAANYRYSHPTGQQGLPTATATTANPTHPPPLPTPTNTPAPLPDYFVWTAQASNISGHITFIDNADTNGRPDAILLVTPPLQSQQHIRQPPHRRVVCLGQVDHLLSRQGRNAVRRDVQRSGVWRLRRVADSPSGCGGGRAAHQRCAYAVAWHRPRRGVVYSF
jgi:hypothetical protein